MKGNKKIILEIEQKEVVVNLNIPKFVNSELIRQAKFVSRSHRKGLYETILIWAAKHPGGCWNLNITSDDASLYGKDKKEKEDIKDEVEFTVALSLPSETYLALEEQAKYIARSHRKGLYETILIWAAKHPGGCWNLNITSDDASLYNKK